MEALLVRAVRGVPDTRRSPPRLPTASVKHDNQSLDASNANRESTGRSWPSAPEASTTARATHL